MVRTVTVTVRLLFDVIAFDNNPLPSSWADRDMGRKQEDASPDGEQKGGLVPQVEATHVPADELRETSAGPRYDELSPEVWEAVKTALPAEPPPWLHSKLSSLVWSVRTGRFGAGDGDALDEVHREALSRICELSGALHDAVQELPFDLQDALEAIIQERIPVFMRDRYPVSPMQIVAMLPHLEYAARKTRDASDRDKRSGSRRASPKSTGVRDVAPVGCRRRPS